MTNKYDIVVGIDPDVERSGMAFLKVSTRHLEIITVTFPELLNQLNYMLTLKDTQEQKIVIIVEAGWLIKHNWHGKKGDNFRVAAAKGNAAGRNHEVGRIIVQMVKAYGLEVIEQRPLRKCWEGADRKITQKELEAITGYKGKTNQEGRDAALLAWTFANLPIRITFCIRPVKECERRTIKIHNTLNGLQC